MNVTHESLMGRVLELASRGRGFVEPNPLVGCVIVQGSTIVAEGWHQKFGGPHAEVHALQAAGEQARDATLIVNLEPCCHQGKTPPCTNAIIQAGVREVVIAQVDPYEKVRGQGIAQLAQAGIGVRVGVLEAEARKLNSPFQKLVQQQRPWVLAKWAMSLDGKIATKTGNSQWISGPSAREIVHQIRGRVDAIVVGKRTVALDDPLLTARPPGPRTPTRIVLSSQADIPLNRRLVQSLAEAPVLVVGSPDASEENVERLRRAGCEVWLTELGSQTERLGQLLDELGRRKMTNALFEGGSKLLGSLFEGGLIDEFHVFIAPLLIGGETAPSPIGGAGIHQLSHSCTLDDVQIRPIDQGVYFSGRAKWSLV